MAASPDPKTLFEADPTYNPPLLSRVIPPAGCAIVGVACSCMINIATKRPVLSGIQKHVAFGLGGGMLGKFLDGRRIDYFAERDAIVRHYIQLHPEDFPTPERPKLRDMFKPWIPIR